MSLSPDVDVVDTYLGNEVRLELDGRRVALVPLAFGSSDSCPTGRLHVVSVWNPHGRVCTVRQNTAAAAHAMRWARAIASFADAAVLAPDLQFVERAVALIGASDFAAAELARRLGQPALLRWDIGGLSVLDSRTGATLIAWPVMVRELTRRPCVMAAGQGDSPCRLRGGPWTEGAREAARRSQHEWRVKLGLLGGCDVCATGPAPKSAFANPQLSVPSRWMPRSVEVEQ